MIRNRIFTAALMLALILIYIWTNEKLSFCMLVLMAVLVLLSVISNQLGTRYLKAELVTGPCRLFPEDMTSSFSDASEGDHPSGTLLLHLKNKSFLPLPRVLVRFEVKNLLTGSCLEGEEQLMLLPFQDMMREIHLQSMYLGRVETDFLSIESIDMLGICRKRVHAASFGGFDRYPQLTKLNEDLQTPRDEQPNAVDRYLHRRGNDPSEVLDIREYRRGDNVRRIHWKLSAKMRKTMIRELDMPSDQETLVLFGLQESESDLQVHRVVQLALNLSWNLLQQDTAHNLLLLDDTGLLIRNFDVSSEEEYRHVEQRVLTGGICLSAEELVHYLEQTYLTDQYSRVICVTDDPSAWMLGGSLEFHVPEPAEGRPE